MENHATIALGRIIFYGMMFNAFTSSLSPEHYQEMVDVINYRSKELSDMRDSFLRVYGIPFDYYEAIIVNYN